MSKTRPSRTPKDPSSTTHDKQVKNTGIESVNVAKSMTPGPSKTPTKSTRANVQPQRTTETLQGPGKAPSPTVSGPQPTFHPAEPRTGIYVDRFGIQRIIRQSLPQVNIPSPEHPTGPQIAENNTEIAIHTRRQSSEVCRNFTRGYCEWGERCIHIHYFNILDPVNERILRQVFHNSHPERPLGLIGTKLAVFHRWSLQYVPRMLSHSSHTAPQISVANSDSSSDSSDSELDTHPIINIPRSNPSAKPLAQPTTSFHSRELSTFQSALLDPSMDAEKVTINIGSRIASAVELDRWGHETDPSAWLAADLRQDEVKIHELDAWGCEPGTSAWLDAVNSVSSGMDSDLKRWGCETDASAWLADDTSELSASSFESNLSVTTSASEPSVKHPPPRNSEICWRWLRGACERGYNCYYVHGDLEYDQSLTDLRPAGPPAYYATTIHDHIRIKLGAGFSVQEIVTGFETPGYISTISRLDVIVSRSGHRGSLRARARFSSHIEARNANISLNGTLQWGSIVSTQLPWEAPSVVAYAGYPTEARANKAIAIAKAAYSSTYISAHLYSGLPQMGAYTVRFRNLPLDTKKAHLSKYSQPLDVMWDMPNYTSIDMVAITLRRKLETNGISLNSFDVLPPPYRDGRVRAWAHFSSPSAAKAACQLLHLRKPMCTGRTRVFATTCRRYLIRCLWNNTEKSKMKSLFPGPSVIAKLSAEDGKDLGHLKAEFEKLRGGEVVRHNGELEIAHIGLIIRDDASRRRLTLFGQSSLRETVKAILIQKHSELSVREQRYLDLGPLMGPFIHFEFGALSRRLGPEKVFLDLWNRRLVVMVANGQDPDFHIALQAVQRTQCMQNPRLRRDVASCPHAYCRTCLVNYLQAAIDSKFFPLTCLGNDDNCSSLIPISLARQVLSIGEFDSLVEAAFQAHIHERPKEFHYCPSPDCMQVYRPAPRGNVLQCPSCLLRICPQCHVEQHDGFECPDHDGGNRLFNEWANAHDVKNCPECRIPIERAEGCNDVTCTRCRTHICWVCLQTFPGGDGIYSHMRIEHGGIGNAFDADGL
ncbi:hypothetical protein BT96DRAFT_995247 [Gymnopus androsaceus JB14]|uniref:RBR-type E3 ubiquitin transferase n=1 Tax=Gymnopus androsaceus JB14 TaxID=1447944 RepID=A0A6A4HLW7_9AGAR|nr:hypothetical protein BT96DRAFT_995247 [Gymnopus androsaceus JB14]